ncbi:MAG: hypothetical protein J3K34DRAFT_524465 [Monoraphidium minutum]|nr:MAG: hypothetical protein J3K34DRAFT_524465 [Monoraphidium minutum]
MSRRETLGALSPNSRPTMAGRTATGKEGGAGRQSLAMKPGRPSMAPGALLDRRSSAFGKGAAGLKQDPRPLGDKNFLNACIRTVITYLSTHGYPYAVSPKVLTSPTGKDFAQIVQFLFQRFDTSMKAFGKVEDEVPLFFKRLNYPFQISKSALFAVGSPHSWPSVLAALTWLVELLNYEEKAEEAAADPAGPGALDNERQRSERAFYEYVSGSYRSFLSGDDARCAAADEEMLGQIRDREDALAAELESTREASEGLRRTLESLRTAPSPLVAATAARDECARDKAKFEAALENMRAAKATCVRKVEERKAELSSRKQQLTDVLQDNDQLRAQISNQTLSRADVNRLLAERGKLKGVLDSVVGAREGLERRAYDQEMQVESSLKDLEESVRQYNLAAHRLKLIPASAKRASGTNFELAVARAEEAPQGLVGADIKGVIKPGLVALRERYRGRARDLAEDGLGLAEQLDAAREAVRERAEDVANAQLQVGRLDTAYRALRDDVDGDMRATGEQADKIKARLGGGRGGGEDEVASRRNAAAGALSDAEERMRAAVADYEALQRRCQSELETLRRATHQALDSMMQHRLDIRHALDEVRNSSADAARAVVTMPMPHGGGGEALRANPFALPTDEDLLGDDLTAISAPSQRPLPPLLRPPGGIAARVHGQPQQRQAPGAAVADLLDLSSGSPAQAAPGPPSPFAGAAPWLPPPALRGAGAPPGAPPPGAPPPGGLGRVLSDHSQGGVGRRMSTASSMGGVGLEDLDPSHPLDMTPGDLASLGLRPGAGRRRGGEVGVHGDAPAPGDDEVRIVQLQTFGGEGVPDRWRRLMARLGVKKKRPQGAFPSNELVTARYNALTFVPVNLYGQFRRVANMYFLALVCLQAIPGLSPVPWWGTLFPLAVVLLVNGVKEAFDDYWRHVSDAQVNRRLVTLLREDGDTAIHWNTVQVGDLLRLHNGDDVPADMVLLASSDPEGLCYVETANLDGETNLKAKHCHPATAAYDCAEAFSRAGYFTVEAEAPNPRLYAFDGAISRWDMPPTALGLAARGPAAARGLRAANGRPGGPGAGGARRPGSPARPGMGGGGGGGGRGGADNAQPLGFDGGGGDVWGQQVGLVSRDPLDAHNLMLRGSKLRKTDWVIGAVVFTGPDTKVVRNMLPAPRKVTRLERSMNGVVVWTLAFLGVLSVALAITNQAWESIHRPAVDWYLTYGNEWPELAPGVAGFLVQVVRFVILMAQAVPISLYVTLETVKVAQCKLLYDRDRAMYWAAEDVPFTSRTTTLNEELGQVEYVLSDKTGTLTQNVMGFVLASAGGRLYGHAPGAGPRPPGGAAAAAAEAMAPQGSVADVPNNTPHTVALDRRLRAAVDPELRRRAAGGGGGGGGVSAAGGGGGAGGDGGPAVDFLLALALCNTVVPTATEEGALLYQASSPDEEALVAAAAYLGVKLVSRSGSHAEIEVAGELQRWGVAAVLEFSSDRKRMSVALRRPAPRGGGGGDGGVGGEGGGGVLLVTKGADNVVLERLAADQPLLGPTTDHLASMSGAGFRTLVVASKDVPEDEWDAWAAEYKEASSSLEGREDKVAACCDRMERGLTLLGATAVEDKLQDGVPEAIAGLKAAGIKVWVLTGDKMETAVSIAHTCRLLNPSMALLRVREADLRSGRGPPEAAAALARGPPPPPPGGGPARAGSIRGIARRVRSLLGGGGGGGGGAPPPGAPAAALGSGDAVARSLAALRAAAAPGVLPPAMRPGGGGGGGAAQASGVGLVIDGAALALALQPALELEFLELCRGCAAVVCCRVSPMQKAQVARLLKRSAGAVTLAIGDGANDVSMIQARSGAAHIGVGISGREGRAAVQSADFAFGQFRRVPLAARPRACAFLLRLLLVHGRQSYLRCREVVLYAFYKNAAYVSCFVLFGLYSGFSAQPLFFSVYIATFNAVWSALPTIAYGLCEQDVSCAAAMANPQLYSETRTQTGWHFVRAWILWIGLGLWHGAVAFFIPLNTMATPNRAGSTASVYLLGTAVMTSVLVIVTMRVAIRTQHWTAVNHAAVWGTLGLWLPFLGTLAALCSSTPGLAPLCGLGAGLLATPQFWAGAVVGAPAAALLADYSLMAFQRLLAPRASQVLQEIEKLASKGAHVPLGGALQPSARLATPAASLPLAPSAGSAPHALAAAAGAGAGDVEAARPSPLGPGRQQQQQQAAAALPPGRAASFGAALRSEGSRAPLVPEGGAAALPSDQITAWAAADDAYGAAPPAAAAFGLAGAPDAPPTLGGVAAAEWAGPFAGELSPEWAGNFVMASPQVLAQSHTKRQARVNRRGPRGAAGFMGPLSSMEPPRPPAAAATQRLGGGGGGGGVAMVQLASGVPRSSALWPGLV